MWRGDFSVNLIGPEDEKWDEILIMQYPARGSFERMLADPDYKSILFYRAAAVKDPRLYGATLPRHGSVLVVNVRLQLGSRPSGVDA